MSYARYKFNKAVRSLREAGARRLEWLGSENANRLLRMTTADVPTELKREFQLLQQEMKPIQRLRELDAREWAILRDVDEATVGRIIDRIMRMHTVIESSVEKKQISGKV